MAAKKAGSTGKGSGGKKGSMGPVKMAEAKDPAKHHPKSQFAGAPPPRSLQQPRISTTVPPSGQSSLADPRSASLHSAFQSPHLSGGGQAPQHSPYAASHDSSYYASHPSPHSAVSTTGHYPPAEGSDQMAATAHMHRPFPPIYHNPQASSPASVASPQTHDQHGRSLYGQAPSQVAQPMYGYPQYSPMSQVHPSHFSQHSAQQSHHPMPHASMMQPPSSNPQLQQQPMGQPGGITSSSPRLRMDGMPQQHPHHQHPQQQQPHTTPQQYHHQQPQQQHTSHHQPSQQQQQPPPPPPPPPPPGQPSMARMIQQHPTQPPSIAANNIGLGQTPASNINPSAAPGPIPATTPLVVRQDGNGVQWIAFEYSRDRVKSEYTIRCDVESVNVDSLGTDFKNENCVYPRACCGKDGYKGNRLNYETECNAVGWALAELNVCLRGKRGLIQRAVDSWRNSNQDPRLRSRRVRRQAKNQQRNKNTQQAVQVGGASSAGMVGVSGSTSATPIRVPSSGPVASMGAPQLQHHHHARPEMVVPGQPDSSARVDYSSVTTSASPSRPHLSQRQPLSTPTDLGPGREFAGYPSYPPTSSGGSPILRSDYLSVEALGRRDSTVTVVSGPTSTAPPTAPSLADLPPESRKQKFEESDGPRADDRFRLGMHFGHEGSNVSPRTYPSYPHFPRISFPPSMPAPVTTGRLPRSVLARGNTSIVGQAEVEGSSFDSSQRRAIIPSGGEIEISEEQASAVGRRQVYKQGHSLPRSADWSPALIDRRITPPYVRCCE